MLLGLILPAGLIFNIFWWYTMREWGKSNDDFYGRALDTYVSLLDKKIEELETFAAEISAESRENNSMLQGGDEALSDNTYQVYMAIREMKEKYARRDVTDWGIYFYDINRIITPGYSFTPESFLYKYTGRTNGECMDFFSENNYKSLSTLFDSTNSEDDYNGFLLVGICTSVGDSNSRALIFYLISPSDINNSLAIVGGEGISYYLLEQDSDGPLLVWGDDPEEKPGNILNGTVWVKTAGMRQRVLYNIKSSCEPLSVTAYISERSLQNDIMNWVGNVKILLLFLILILLITCSAAICIAYKPMYELTNEFDYSEGNEFDTIRHRLNDQGHRIGEQQMLILDLLIEHLIYGVPISEERFKQLGIEEYMRYYCVFLVDGYSLLNSKVEKFTQEIEKKYGVRFFVTDWYGENCSVMIAFMKTEDIAYLQTMLEEWLKEGFEQKYTLYTGKVSDRIEDIQLSFRSCLDQMKKKRKKEKLDTDTLTPKKEQQKKLAEEILSYLDEHYRDSSLSQMQVADHFKISNYTLSRLFKNQVGIGFAEYLAAKRLEYAKELLLTTSYSVRDISVMVGFTSENYFSRTFKLYEGVSPSNFRNK